MDCIFCKCANGEVDANIVYQDQLIMAFADIAPQAPHHFLIIPRNHIATLNDINPDQAQMLGHMVITAKNIAVQHGMAEKGYRLVWNWNADGGQAVYQIHLHVLGGRKMTWPPG